MISTKQISGNSESKFFNLKYARQQHVVSFNHGEQGPKRITFVLPELEVSRSSESELLVQAAGADVWRFTHNYCFIILCIPFHSESVVTRPSGF
jgi:hypothetical protein